MKKNKRININRFLSILADQPYDAKYLLLVYGPRVYDSFTSLARGLIATTYQLPNDKESIERAHTLFLLLMVILLFSDGFESGFEAYLVEPGQQQSRENESHISSMNRSLSTTSESRSSASSSSLSSLSSAVSPSLISKLNEKLNKIQQTYVELACRYLHDEFGLAVGRQMFQKLLPLLFGKSYFYYLVR